MNRPTRGRGGLRIGRSSASSLTDSLRSVVRLRRAVSTHSKAVIRLSTESGDNAGKNMQNALRPARETSEHDRRRVPRRPRSGGRPPPPRTRSARRRRHRRRGRADCSSNRSPARRSTRSGTTASPRRPPSPPSRTWSARSRCRWASPAPSASTAAPSPAKYLPSTTTRGRAPRVGQPRFARSSTAPAADRPRPQVRDDPRAGVPRRRRCRGRALVSWTRDNFAALKEAAEDDEPRRTPRRDAVRRRQLGVPAIPLRHQGRDGDEHGHHRHRAVCGVVEAETAASLVALSGNLCSDKARRHQRRRGARPGVTADVQNPARGRRRTPAHHARSGRGTQHTQEPGRLREGREPRVQRPRRQRRRRDVPRHRAGRGASSSGANAITTAEVQDGDLYVSVSIASLEVGTVGGGETPTQSGASISSASAAAATRRLQRRRPRQMHRRRFPRGRTLPSLRARSRGTSPAPPPNSVGNCMGVVVRPRFIGSEFVDPTLIMNVLSRGDTTRLRDTRYNAYHEHIITKVSSITNLPPWWVAVCNLRPNRQV